MDVTRRWALAILVFLAIGVAGLGIRPMVVPDEPRYGIIPAEMVETGNWLALRMNGFVYYEKPPMGYWLTAASIRAFGQNAFAIRLPSALATLAVALVAGWLAARISGDRRDGPTAFLVQATTLGPMVLGTVAILDPPFAAFVGASMACLYCGCTSAGRARAGWLALAGAAAGFAFLTKGLLAFAIPGVTALAFLAWERRWRDMLTMPWIPLAAAAATIAPFAWAVHRAEPGFWEYLIVIEHFRRVASPDSNQHPEPWWHFLAVFPVGAMLWTIMWPAAAKGLRAAGEWRSGVRFMLCWAVVPIAMLSLSSGKLPTYVLPMFAPVSVLVALGLRRGHQTGAVRFDAAARFARRALYAFAVLAAVLAAVGLKRLGIPEPWPGGESARLAWIALALTAWALADAWAWRAGDAWTWLVRAALAPGMMFLFVPFAYPSALLSSAKHPWELLARNAGAIGSAKVVVACSDAAHAVSWSSGRRDVSLVGGTGEFDNELALPEESHRRLAWEELRSVIAAARPAPVAVVCSAHEAAWILDDPSVERPAVVDRSGGLVVMRWE
jgi:4-amino-4-deoxy-L-arabinose transferase